MHTTVSIDWCVKITLHLTKRSLGAMIFVITQHVTGEQISRENVAEYSKDTTTLQFGEIMDWWKSKQESAMSYLRFAY